MNYAGILYIVVLNALSAEECSNWSCAPPILLLRLHPPNQGSYNREVSINCAYTVLLALQAQPTSFKIIVCSDAKNHYTGQRGLRLHTLNTVVLCNLSFLLIETPPC